MSKYAKAFVVGGWGETEEYIQGLTNEIQLEEGPHGFVEHAEGITLAEALRHKRVINKDAEKRLVVTHSAGIMAIDNAGVIVALNGPEPTLLPRTIMGGRRVIRECNITPDDYVTKTSAWDGVDEVLHHPVTWAVPFLVQCFSTVRKLARHERAFPGGRIYLQTESDEFGFGSGDNIEWARQNGIIADMLPGFHNQPMLRPREGAEQISIALARLTVLQR